MAEYGWPLEYVLDCVTPRQAQLWCERIWRRQREQVILRATATRKALAAVMLEGGAAEFDAWIDSLTPSDDPAEEIAKRRKPAVRVDPGALALGQELGMRVTPVDPATLPPPPPPNPHIQAWMERRRAAEAAAAQAKEEP